MHDHLPAGAGRTCASRSRSAGRDLRAFGSQSWRELFGLFAALTATSAVTIYLIVPETTPVASGAVSVGLRKVYADRRFWRLAPLSASCIGTAWALQGLWAAQWLRDVEGLDRAGVVAHLVALAIAAHRVDD